MNYTDNSSPVGSGLIVSRMNLLNRLMGRLKEKRGVNEYFPAGSHALRRIPVPASTDQVKPSLAPAVTPTAPAMGAWDTRARETLSPAVSSNVISNAFGTTEQNGDHTHV